MTRGRSSDWFRLLLLTLGIALGACSRDAPPTAERGAGPALPAISGAEAGAGRRIALVVGNGRYASAPLVNPVNDAALVSTTLKQLGFEVQLVQDGDQRRMKRAIQEFGATLESSGADAVGLFYYAGHGVQLNGRNYLIPVGAEIQRDADVEIEAVSADWVIEQMRFARNRLNFVVLDACRNNPFARSFRSADRGLAKMDAPAGVLIAYSTAPGDVAADGDGRNSPYSEALSDALLSSNEPAELMFKRVRDQVRRNTSQRQTPWESSSLTGENFYFARQAPGSQPAAATPAAAAVSPAVTSVSAPVAPPAPAPARESGPEAVTDVPYDPANPAAWEKGLCLRAPGEWLVDSEKTPGTVKLQAGFKGTANLRNLPSKTVTWTCDAPNRRLRIRFENGVEHIVTMDYVEKLIFGYDQDGTALTYNR